MNKYTGNILCEVHGLATRHASRKAMARAMGGDKEGNRDEKDAIVVARPIKKRWRRRECDTFRSPFDKALANPKRDVRPNASRIRRIGTRFVLWNFAHEDSGRVY